MKRAFFKIGQQISFESHTRTEELKIEINVNKWKNDHLWQFPFTYARAKKSSAGGTTIEVTNLHDPVKDQFGQSVQGDSD